MKWFFGERISIENIHLMNIYQSKMQLTNVFFSLQTKEFAIRRDIEKVHSIFGGKSVYQNRTKPEHAKNLHSQASILLIAGGRANGYGIERK